MWGFLIWETPWVYDAAVYHKDGSLKLRNWLLADNGYVRSSDALTHDMTLRPGIKFHNTGTEMTAVDLKYAIDRVNFFKMPIDIVGSTVTYPEANFDHAEVVDKYTCRLVCKVPDVAIPQKLSNTWYGVYDSVELEKHAVTGAGGLSDHGFTYLYQKNGDVYSGPYQVKQFNFLARYELAQFFYRHFPLQFPFEKILDTYKSCHKL